MILYVLKIHWFWPIPKSISIQLLAGQPRCWFPSMLLAKYPSSVGDVPFFMVKSQFFILNDGEERIPMDFWMVKRWNPNCSWWKIPIFSMVKSPCSAEKNPRKNGAWDSSQIKVFNCSTEAWRKSTATQRYWYKYIYIQYMNIQFYLYTYDIIWIHMICTCICPWGVQNCDHPISAAEEFTVTESVRSQVPHSQESGPY